MKILNNYFKDAEFYKPTGDGLLVILAYDEESLKEKVNVTLDICLSLVDDFVGLCEDEPMVNYPTPNNIGIGIARGSACCISSKEKKLDYSGRVLNLASRLMEVARPSGVVFDDSFGIELLEEEMKSQFSEDEIYLRGIAETDEIKIYYSNTHVIVSDSFKRAINEPSWMTVERICTYSEYKTPKTNTTIMLEGRALTEDSIRVRISHNAIKNGKPSELFTHFYDSKTGDEVIYRQRGKKAEVVLTSAHTRKIMDRMKSHRLPDDWDIKCEVMYIRE